MFVGGRGVLGPTRPRSTSVNRNFLLTRILRYDFRAKILIICGGSQQSKNIYSLGGINRAKIFIV